jgi:hypothetical protein
MQPGCSDCTCGAAVGSCTPAAVNGHLGPGCGQNLTAIVFDPFECYNIQNNCAAFTLQPSTPLSASCPPGASAPIPLDATTLCKPEVAPSDPCEDGGICVPAGDATFDSLCNLVPADEPCAPGWDVAEDVAEVLGDDRSCSCSCGAPTGQTCVGGSVSYWEADNNDCSGAPIGSSPDDGVCHTTTQTTNGSLQVDPGTLSGGTCAATTTTNGQVTFGPPQKLCCQPPG